MSSAESLTIPESIKHPNMFYVSTGGHWSNTRYHNLWNASSSTAVNADVAVSKTIYDPCPAGFKVPNRNVFASFTSSNILGEWNQGWTFKTNASDTEGIFFPSSFLRDYDSGGIDEWRRYGATIGGVSYEGYLGGYYWTATSYHSNAAYWGGIYFELRDHGNYVTTPTLIPAADLGPVGYGFSVRPIKE